MPSLQSRLRVSMIVLGAVAACGRKPAEPVAKAPPPSITVPLVIASEAPTPDVLALTGTIVANQRSEVTANTAGRVIAVMVQRGQHVTQGQPVVRLDVRSAALSTAEARANLEAASTEKWLAEQDCAKTGALLDQGAITRSQADRELARCTSAGKQVSAARARTAMLGKGVSDGIVRAPFDGVVADKAITVGEWVAPGRPLFTLVDAGVMKIELSVPEAHVTSVAVGQPVELVAVAHPGRSYRATITQLGAEIGRTRSLIVEAVVEPTADLKPGMYAEARLVIGHTVRPVVPATAVVKRGKTWHAFVVDHGELEDRIVKLGPSPGPGQVSIVTNITKGDRLTSVTDQIVDGLRVD